MPTSLPRPNHLPQGMLTLVFKDRQDLQHAYMPFMKPVGLFVVTDRPYQMGDDVFLMVKLPESEQRHATAGKVVWINPKGGHRAQGVGVSFIEGPSADTLRTEIEKLLLGAPKNARAKHTF